MKKLTFPALQSLVALLVAGLLTLSLSACDSGGSDEGGDINNRFSLEVNAASPSEAGKAAQETIEGFSFFVQGQDPQTGEQGFALYFADDQEVSQQTAQQGLFGIIARASTRPGTGTYSVGDPEGDLSSSTFFMVLYKDISAMSGTYYLAEGGTLNITRSGDDRLEASVDVRATEFSFDSTTNQPSTQPVTITGTITAENAETFLGFSGFTP